MGPEVRTVHRRRFGRRGRWLAVEALAGSRRRGPLTWPLRSGLRPPRAVDLGALALPGLAGADRRDALGERHLEALGGLAAVVEAGELDHRQPAADGALDGAQAFALGLGDEGEGVAGRCHPGGAADAVDVVVGLVRNVEVDHV